MRVDNVVYRSGWARTRPQARQFVSHGLITVNGKRVTIPSLRVRPGDVVALGRKTADLIAVRHNLDTLGRIVPAWLERNGEGNSTTVLGVPMREQIDVPVDEAMVVELYSR